MAIRTLRTGANAHPESNVLQFITDLINTSGVLDISGTQFKVSAQSSPDTTVKVSLGRAYIKATSGNAYPVIMDADTNVQITANASGNPRIDVLVLYIDLSASPTPTADNVAKLAVVAGTPAGSPVAPNSVAIQSAIGASNPYISLGQIAVASGFSSIVSGNITDLRTALVISDIAKTKYLNLSEGQVINGQIVPSVSSNNLTVALKTLAGTDPSTSDPVYVRIGNTIRTITSALSVTKNAGTNYFGAGGSMFATKEIDYFVYLGYNTTDGVTIAFSRIPYARKYSDFSVTFNHEKYAGFNTIANATANDVYQNIGRFNAIMSASASYNWSLPATQVIINYPIFETRTLFFVPTLSVYGAGTTFTRDANGGYETYKVVGDRTKINWACLVTPSANTAHVALSPPFTIKTMPALANTDQMPYVGTGRWGSYGGSEAYASISLLRALNTSGASTGGATHASIIIEYEIA